MVRLSCGRDIDVCPDINKCLKESNRSQYEFICVHIVNPLMKRVPASLPDASRPLSTHAKFSQPMTRSDMLLSSGDWSRSVVAKVSPHLDVDSACSRRRLNDEKMLSLQLEYAAHLGVPSVIVDLKSNNCENLANRLNRHLIRNTSQSIWIKVPLIARELQLDDIFSDESEIKMSAEFERSQLSTWNWWNKMRMICNTPKNMGVALELTTDIPDQHVIDTWKGESVKALVIPTSLFISNKKGYPVLSKPHQEFIRSMFKFNVQVIISGPNLYSDKVDRVYHQYMEHLFNTIEAKDKLEEYCIGYEDYLQCPLQPLMDNLESQTYEVFEKDPVKYSQYGLAIAACLRDKALEIETGEILLMVLGAGRGPLMTCSIKAAKDVGVWDRITLVAMEKNVNAIVTLINMNHDKWNNKVEIINADMRSEEVSSRFKGKSDIIVSELLGSFGDNELSPECLDGAQFLLKPNGVSIPKNYTSFLAPISSMKLWEGARNLALSQEKKDAAFETPYVVRLHTMDELCPAKPVFRFEHPNNEKDNNNRYIILDYEVNKDFLMHGFSGYFECVLYNDIMISILPSTHSPGMFSWFPIYLPIKEPLFLRKDDHLRVHFWRKNNGKEVWYEWCVSEPEPKPLHNANGRSYTIGL